MIMDGQTDDQKKNYSQEIKILFTKLQAKAFTDLQFYKWNDIQKLLDQPQNKKHFPTIHLPLNKTKTSYIFRYAKLGAVIDITLTLQDIRQYVDDDNKSLTNPRGPSMLTNPKSSLKIKVPDIPTWDGTAASFYPWKERAMDTLGQAGVLKYIGDPQAVNQEPDVAEAVFFALRKALSKGTANTPAT